jgi:hypothetical protein
MISACSSFNITGKVSIGTCLTKLNIVNISNPLTE